MLPKKARPFSRKSFSSGTYRLHHFLYQILDVDGLQEIGKGSLLHSLLSLFVRSPAGHEDKFYSRLFPPDPPHDLQPPDTRHFHIQNHQIEFYQLNTPDGIGSTGYTFNLDTTELQPLYQGRDQLLFIVNQQNT